jgi:hypothetical protein
MKAKLIQFASREKFTMKTMQHLFGSRRNITTKAILIPFSEREKFTVAHLV